MAKLTRASLPTSSPLRLMLAPLLPAVSLLTMSIAIFRESQFSAALGLRSDPAKAGQSSQNRMMEEKLVRLCHWSRMMTSIMFSRNMLQQGLERLGGNSRIAGSS